MAMLNNQRVAHSFPIASRGKKKHREAAPSPATEQCMRSFVQSPEAWVDLMKIYHFEWAIKPTILEGCMYIYIYTYGGFIKRGNEENHWFRY